MMKGLLSLLMVTAFCITGYAQISGTVTDESSLPVTDVGVSVEGSDATARTDDDGNYSIDANVGDVLVFKAPNFQTKKVNAQGETVDVTLSAGNVLDELVLVGSRSAGRTAIESAVPVDVIDVAQLASVGPQVNINQILNYVAPSFTSNTQTISDGTDHVDPATLRGLGPDQVLVLINGKRRHTSALINVNGTFGRGNVGTDLNSIPTAAIKKIEILRDGAAAQYGSDAIAGVINIVLKDETGVLNINTTSGSNVSRYSNEQTGGWDGEAVNVSGSYGIKLGDRGSFTLAGDFDFRNDFNRMREWEGSIFNGLNSVEWVAAQTGGYDLNNLSLSDIQLLSLGVSHFDTATKDAIQNAGSLADVAGLLNFDTTEAELAARGQTRSDYNMRVGQSRLRGGRVMGNLSFKLDDNGTELYAFGGLSGRRGNSAGFYRLPNQERANSALYINGFLPEINSRILDKSMSVGIRGQVKDWDVDFSHTYGNNTFTYLIGNTANASLEGGSPREFDAGGFGFTQNTTNLDLRKSYDFLSGVNVAVGGEYRTDAYEITAGEEASWELYDESGNPVPAGGTTGATDFFGRSRPAGAQVFPGFRPENEVLRERNNVAGYVDLEVDVTEKWLVTGAFRYENFSDFGDTYNYKVATRYKITPDLNIRAAGTTGFRAPSLQQSFFSSTSTIFVDGIPNEVALFTNQSQVAQTLGIPELRQEESVSVSAGLAGKIASAGLKFSVDAYFIGVDDRIVLTGEFQANGDPLLEQAFDEAGATRAAFFANAIDTETKGIDVVVEHSIRLGSDMKLSSNLAASYNITKQVDDINSSEVLRNSGQAGTFFDERARIFLERAVPRFKANLSHTLTKGKFTGFLRNVYFGQTTEASNTLPQEFTPKIVTDVSVGYEFLEGLNLTIGSNNVFDVYPDRAVEGLRSSGRFDWSRTSPQFGTAGRFLFARLQFNIK